MLFQHAEQPETDDAGKTNQRCDKRRSETQLNDRKNYNWKKTTIWVKFLWPGIQTVII